MASVLEAAAAGNVDLVRSTLKEGADPSFETAEGWTALIRAAAGGHVAVVALLLEAGASPNPTRLAHTPLRAAALYGHDAIGELLLGARADPNMPSIGLRTALMGCAFARASEPGYTRAGTLALARRLLRARAAPDVHNDAGETALALAVLRVDLEMAELLLDHGADPRVASPSGLTPAQVAALSHSRRSSSELCAKLMAAANSRAASPAHQSEEELVCAGAGPRPPAGGSDLFVASRHGAVAVRVYRHFPEMSQSQTQPAGSDQRVPGSDEAAEPSEPAAGPGGPVLAHQHGRRLLVCTLHDAPPPGTAGTGTADSAAVRWAHAAAAMRWVQSSSSSSGEGAIEVISPDLCRFGSAYADNDRDTDVQGALALSHAVECVASALAQLRGDRAVVLCGTGWGARVADGVVAQAGGRGQQSEYAGALPPPDVPVLASVSELDEAARAPEKLLARMLRQRR
jgi:ankyrin repeat protein